MKQHHQTKWIAGFCAVTCLLAGMTGCGSTEDSSKNAHSAKSHTAEESAETVAMDESLAPYLEGVEDSWMAEVECDGVTMSLPMQYSAFEEAFGSVDIENYSDRTLTAGSNVSGSVGTEKYDSSSFSAHLMNYENESKEYTDCCVYSCGWKMMSSLSGDSSDVYDSYPTVTLPEGITWGSTVEEIKAAYGDPHNESNSTSYTTLSYFDHFNDSAYFYFFLTVNDDFGLIDIDWEIHISGIEYDEEEATSSNPEGWLSEVTCDGVTLSLPSPSSVIEELGCSISWDDYSYDGDDFLEPNTAMNGYYLESDKYDPEICQVSFVNDSDTNTARIKDCDINKFIWNIATTIDDKRTIYDAYPEVILPDGITWGSTIEEIEAAYGEADAKYDTSDADGYSLSYTDRGDDEVYHLELTVYHDLGLTYIKWYTL